MSYDPARSYANAYAAKILAKKPVPASGSTEHPKMRKPFEYGLIMAIVGFILGAALPLYLRELFSLQQWSINL